MALGIVLIFILAFVFGFIVTKRRRGTCGAGASFASSDIFRYANNHNKKEVKKLKSNSIYWIVAVIILLFFPFLAPIAAMGFAVFVISKTALAKKGSSFKKEKHGDERYDHHEDECINCGTDFSDDVNEDCMFCGDGNNYDSSFFSSHNFDIEKAFNNFGKNVSDFAKKSRDSYENSAWKPKIEKASGRLKEELTMQDKDTDEEAFTYSGTYDDAKEEAEGLKVLLKAGIIEKDEYNDRMAELKNRQ